MILGETIKMLRLRKGLTQEQVCKRANLTQGFYSAIENGATPSLETLNRLAEVFALPVFFIIWLATDKRDILKNQRGWYNNLKPILDNIIEEVITTKK